ncbi:hypothetical protein R3P38DRAFT_3190858 [Favolaschia claudopus]|uniref:GIY-YIG nuclease family protein n=1 Tax=Favolaschia claudopus TaxID=2862362 RepID=A0AAW0BQI2_9AGAR
MVRCPRRGKSSRDTSRTRSIARIRRLTADAQIPALLAYARHGRPYLREGRGYLYLNQTRSLDSPERVIWKVGETKNLGRRRKQYDACDVITQHRWFLAFHVQKRLLAERIIQLSFLSQSAGGERVRFDRRCPCGHRHREYVYFPNGKSVDDVVAIIFDALALLGETNFTIKRLD